MEETRVCRRRPSNYYLAGRHQNPDLRYDNYRWPLEAKEQVQAISFNLSSLEIRALSRPINHTCILPPPPNVCGFRAKEISLENNTFRSIIRDRADLLTPNHTWQRTAQRTRFVKNILSKSLVFLSKVLWCAIQIKFSFYN